jgi:hypothetical protein
VSNQKLNLKGLILFFVGFFIVAISALGVGFFVLPLLLDQQEEVPQVTIVDLPTKEEVVVEPLKKPNTFISVESGSLRILCGTIYEAEGKKVGFFFEEPTACSISHESNKAEVKFLPNEEYLCFVDGFSSCRTKDEQRKADDEEEVKHVASSAKLKIAAPKISNKKPKSRIKNEAEVVVTGPAMLTVSTDIESTVFVDGKKIRKAPLFKYEVSPGTHTVIIYSEADATKRKKFTIQTESGMNYIRKWSFQNDTWLKKIP